MTENNEWERMETVNGIPYYVNQETGQAEWNHPLLEKVLESLGSFNVIRYAAYRTAMKIRYIQKSLQMHLISLWTVDRTFEAHGYCVARTTETMDCFDLESLLINLYTEAKRDRIGEIRVAPSVDICFNFLLDLFDPNRVGSLPIKSVKTILYLLSCGKLTEKYKLMFREACRRESHVDREGLTEFLVDLMRLLSCISEASVFGGFDVSPTIDSCFSMADPDGVDERCFLRWLQKEPQTLVWVHTLHRLSVAENVLHDCKCRVCKERPIAGLRYKCLDCFNYNLCQGCFFTGKVNKAHKLNHRIHEHCVPVTSIKESSLFACILQTNWRKRQPPKQRYLPIPIGDRPGHVQLHSQPTNDAPLSSLQPAVDAVSKRENGISHSSVLGSHCDSAPKCCSRLELERMIGSLKAENDEITQELGGGSDLAPWRKELLLRRQEKIKSQLECLNGLLQSNGLADMQMSFGIPRLQSTPGKSPERARSGNWSSVANSLSFDVLTTQASILSHVPMPLAPLEDTKENDRSAEKRLNDFIGQLYLSKPAAEDYSASLLYVEADDDVILAARRVQTAFSDFLHQVGKE